MGTKIFASYGAPSDYLDRYAENRWRSSELVKSWKRNGACDVKYQEMARSRGLEMRIPEYSEDHEGLVPR